MLQVTNTNSNFLALFSKTPVFTAEEKGRLDVFDSSIDFDFPCV